MRRLLKWFILLGGIVIVAGLGYAAMGYRTALADVEGLQARADALIENGQGGLGLGDNLSMLLAVEDPAFLRHAGFDLTTPGIDRETLPQMLAPKTGPADWTPALISMRRTGYAIGLDRALSKPQILALFLDSVAMGSAPDGSPVTGFYAAADVHFAMTPDRLDADRFARLVAVIDAPDKYDLANPSPALEERAARILRLYAGTCRPQGRADTALDGCAK